MTEQTYYTDEDLLTEAAKQHHAATTDPDFTGVGEQMDDECGALNNQDDFDEAQRKIHGLISNAADLSGWAVALGAEGLVPDGHVISISADESPLMRLHFAFSPELSEEDRDRLVMGIAQTASRAMSIIRDA